MPSPYILPGADLTFQFIEEEPKVEPREVAEFFEALVAGDTSPELLAVMEAEMLNALEAEAPFSPETQRWLKAYAAEAFEELGLDEPK